MNCMPENVAGQYIHGIFSSCKKETSLHKWSLTCFASMRKETPKHLIGKFKAFILLVDL